MAKEEILNGEQKVDDIDKEIKLLKQKRRVLANNTSKEGVDSRKFINGMANIFNPVLWLKDFASIFNLRKIIIIGVILATLFGAGYFRGRGSSPVLVNVDDFEAVITIKEGMDAGDNLRLRAYRGNLYYQILRQNGFESKEYVVRNRDIPKLKAWGIGLKPKIFAGIGIGGPAIGAGFEVAHFWRFNLDIFGMSDKAIYVGVSYDLESKNRLLSNSSIGLALGKSIMNATGGTNVMVYWSWRF